MLFLAFIRGAFAGSNSLGGWTMTSVTSYYFLLILGAAFLMSHTETPILRDDIEKGELAGRLLIDEQRFPTLSPQAKGRE